MTSKSLGSSESTVEESFRYKNKLGGRFKHRKPWHDEEGNVIWRKSRILIFKWTQSQLFEMIMGCVIIFNLITIVIETDQEADCYPIPLGQTISDCETRSGNDGLMGIANLVMLLIYTAEAMLRFYAEHWEYFKIGWNQLDVLIITTGWLSEVFRSAPHVSFLRFLRTMRLLRMMRIFISFRELYLLVSGLMSAFKTLFFSAFMLFALLTLWSIILVEHVHPVNSEIVEEYEGCTRCPRAFKSVMTSNLTLFQQIVTGDSWGMVSIPVIEKEPALALILVSIVVSISLGLMNLVLAVIVERAQDAREQDREAKLKQKEAEQEEQKLELFSYCQAMDDSGDGQVDLEELLTGYETMTEFRDLLTLMDIQKDELTSVFKLLDKDCSGSVSYEEFCEELHKIRTRDTRTMLTFLKLTVTELGDKLKEVAADQTKAMGETQEMIGSVHQRLEKLAEMGPQRPAGPAPAERSSTRLSNLTRLAEEGSNVGLVDALGKDARELASMKNGIVARVDAQVEMLLHHAEWLSSLGVALPPAETTKVQRAEEKMLRLRENLYEAEKQLEGSAAFLARNTELLSGLSKEMDYQPKAGQRRLFQDPSVPATGMSPRVGHPPSKLVPKQGDNLRDSTRSTTIDGGSRRNSIDSRRGSFDMGAFDLGRCASIDRAPGSQM